MASTTVSSGGSPTAKLGAAPRLIRAVVENHAHHRRVALVVLQILEACRERGRAFGRPLGLGRVPIEANEHLRIIDDELWSAVKARQSAIRGSEGVSKARATRFWERRRARPGELGN